MKNTLIITLAILAMIACNKDEDTTDAVLENTESADLSDAKLLIAHYDKSEYNTIIHQITKDDRIEELAFTPERKDFYYTQVDVSNPLRLSKQYIALEIGSFQYLLDIYTGKLNKVSLEISQYSSFYSDNNGYVYYQNTQHQVVKCNLSASTKPTEEIYSFKEDCIVDFVIDEQGNMVYYANYDDEPVLRAVSAVGNEKKNLPNNSRDMDPYLSVDGKITYTNLFRGYGEYMVKVGFNPISADTIFVGEHFPAYKSAHIRMEKAGYNIMYYRHSFFHIDSQNHVTELNDDNVWEMEEFVTMKANSKCYYAVYKKTNGATVLCKIDPATAEVSNIIENRYEVISIGVTEDNTVYFKALDLQTFTSIIAKVDDSKSITVIDNDFAEETEFIVLE